MLPQAHDLTTDIYLLVSLAVNGLAGSLLIHFLLQRRREIQASKEAMKKFEAAVLQMVKEQFEESGITVPTFASRSRSEKIH